MPYDFTKVNYDQLKPRQKENYNFQKVSSVLADYGFTTLRLFDDWQGADFIAQHIDGKIFLKVQLKARMTFAKKYIGKDILVAFSEKNHWYLYPHDKLFKRISTLSNMAESASWKEKGLYHFPTIPKQYGTILKKYLLQ